jgi:hypothetical protein
MGAELCWRKSTSVRRFSEAAVRYPTNSRHSTVLGRASDMGPQAAVALSSRDGIMGFGPRWPPHRPPVSTLPTSILRKMQCWSSTIRARMAGLILGSSPRTAMTGVAAMTRLETRRLV